MQRCKLPCFRSFCESNFHLTYRASSMKDRRSDVQIPAATVYHAVFLMGSLALGSLLACDQTLRTPIGQLCFNRKKPVVSDTTSEESGCTTAFMARSLETMSCALASATMIMRLTMIWTSTTRKKMKLELLRPMLYSAYRLGRRQGLSKCDLRSGKLRNCLLHPYSVSHNI